MIAIYNVTTKELIIIGDADENIRPIAKIVREMGEWDTIYDNEGNGLFDFQLDFDDSIDTTSKDTTLNPKNYNLQYVNLIYANGDYHQGDNWQNISLTVVSSTPTLKVLDEKSVETKNTTVNISVTKTYTKTVFLNVEVKTELLEDKQKLTKYINNNPDIKNRANDLFNSIKLEEKAEYEIIFGVFKK